MGAGPFLDGRVKDVFTGILSPFVSLLVSLGASPNVISFLGLVMSGAAGAAFGAGLFVPAAVFIALSGLCDFLDGQIARRTGKASVFGAFLDSTLDRIGEGLIFLGLAWHYSGGTDPASASRWTVAWVLLACQGSFLVSYTRARAEGLGLECMGGIMQRPERMVLLTAGALAAAIPQLGGLAMKATLFILALLSNFTAIERILQTRRRILENTLSEKWDPGKTQGR